MVDKVIIYYLTLIIFLIVYVSHIYDICIPEPTMITAITVTTLTIAI